MPVAQLDRASASRAGVTGFGNFGIDIKNKEFGRNIWPRFFDMQRYGTYMVPTA